MDKDCEVCEKLVRAKHKKEFVWKVLTVMFGIIAVVFMILYFGSGAVITESTIEINGTDITNNGDDNSIIIGSDNEAITGDVKTKDYSPWLIFGGIVIGSVIITGGILIAYHYHKDR